MSCYFSAGGPHAGPIGEVRNVFGKKKAKEECARKTLEYLEHVYRERVAFGQRMMEGVEGGVEEVVVGSVGRGRADEDEVRMGGMGEDVESGSEDGEGFEDAMEDLKH